MGVSFEDVVAVEVLETGQVPPIANFSEIDPALGDDLKLSRGGAYPCKYAMRFAAGFGSQIALALYGAAEV
jgi:3-oxoacyl-(acyl-carrier-protein) synthase